MGSLCPQTRAFCRLIRNIAFGATGKAVSRRAIGESTAESTTKAQVIILCGNNNLLLISDM